MYDTVLPGTYRTYIIKLLLKEKIRKELREKKNEINYYTNFGRPLTFFIISASICGRQENGLQKSKP